MAVLLVVVGMTWASLFSAGCETEGCLAGGEGCTVPSACTELAFECSDRSVELVVISSADEAPGGLDAMGAVGDFLLRNARVEVVIDALEHPADLAPTGGNILDMANRDRDDDVVNHILHVVGALPTDAVAYERSRVIEGEGFVALQVDGHLVGDVRQRVHTRYELRACEPGVRVRTEMVNGSDDTVVWSNADGSWWGGRSMLPFTPTPGAGFVHPGFTLGTLNDVFTKMPFVVGTSHSTPASAVSTVPCNVPEIEGFQSGQVSANGTLRRIVAPRDYEVYERFISVRPGAGAAPGVDVALEVRAQLFDEPYATIRGVVRLAGGRAGALGQATRAAVVISEGNLEDPAEARTPWTHVVPRADGTFEARVPSSRTYVIEVTAFGRTARAVQRDVGDGALDVGELVIPPAGTLTLTATVDGTPSVVQVIVEPADDATAREVTSRFLGIAPDCAPLLGPPFGGSPACNRVLVDGDTTFELPPGRYELFATAGPFATIDRRNVEVTPASSERIELVLVRTAQPAGALSADLHVHGAASFDSDMPDLDRVRTFLAAGVDVIAATDHDAVHDYAEAIRALDATRKLVLIPGVETTGQILFQLNPSVYYPQVVGHWNFWPLPFDDEAPRNGAPWDELVEPGLLFGRVAERGFDPANGIIQLNHPWSNSEFARDLGFPRAIGVKLTDELPRVFDGTGPSLLLRTPPGSAYSNADFHAQEVMNGTNNELFLAHRALWHWELSQGVVRTGTANSDSHTITDNTVGTPRNLVFTSTPRDAFDLNVFNRDVRAGHVLGTNGPLIEAEIVSGGRRFSPSVEAFVPDADAALHLRVHAIAWVPIREVRVLVNGADTENVRIFHADELRAPDDPQAAVDVTRLDVTIPLRDLLPSGNRDAWIVVEAGDPLSRTGDLDCDGVPDTTDNNDDGIIDERDVDRNGDGEVDESDEAEVNGPERCADRYGEDADSDRPGIGPLRSPPPPARDDPSYPFYVVTPGGFPLAFTNPFLLDLNADGTFTGPGL